MEPSSSPKGIIETLLQCRNEIYLLKLPKQVYPPYAKTPPGGTVAEMSRGNNGATTETR